VVPFYVKKEILKLRNIVDWLVITGTYGGISGADAASI